jgi:hypothetical protein
MKRRRGMRKTLFTALVIAAVFTVGPAYGSLTNFGFETGDSTGWTFNLNGGSSEVVGSFTDPYEYFPWYYAPAEGSYFLALEAGDGDAPVTAVQTFHASAGEIIKGMAAFAGGEEYGFFFNDKASVKVYDSNNAVMELFYASTESTGPAGYTAWSLWTWIAPEDGAYTLEYAVINDIDYGGQSFALFDSAQAVPLPPSVLLLAPGLLGMLGLRRRILG